MKSKFQYLFIFIGTIFAFAACSDDIPELETYESVAIVYWMGDNSLNGAADADINELVAGKDDIPENSKIIIYADKSNKMPIIYELDAQNGLKVWKEYQQEEDCTDSLTFLTNLRTITRNFPAKSYGLTFGAHGTGWTWRRRALGPDESHSNKWLNIPTLRGALERLPHFKYIFFDVCFMQSVEIAYELRNVTDWIIGSPAEIPGPGAPFNAITGALCKGDVQGIVEGYNNGYPTAIYNGVILSAVKCSELGNLAATTRTYIESAFANRQTIPYGETQKIQKYASEFSSYTFCYDMNSIMPHILSDGEYSQWLEAFDKAVPMRELNTGSWTAYHCYMPAIYDPDHFGGISMYIPQDSYEGNIKNEELRHYQWFKDAGWSQTGW